MSNKPIADENDDVWGRETVPPSPVKAGDSLGRYEIVEQIGRGGMGEVWKAFDPSENGPVVIKLLPMNLQGNPIEMERIRDSFRRSGNCNTATSVRFTISAPMTGLVIFW